MTSGFRWLLLNPAPAVAVAMAAELFSSVTCLSPELLAPAFVQQKSPEVMGHVT